LRCSKAKNIFLKSLGPQVAKIKNAENTKERRSHAFL
jgi:hypothetical protein